jgi:hypothetical protein
LRPIHKGAINHKNKSAGLRVACIISHQLEKKAVKHSRIHLCEHKIPLRAQGREIVQASHTRVTLIRLWLFGVPPSALW